MARYGTNFDASKITGLKHSGVIIDDPHFDREENFRAYFGDEKVTYNRKGRTLQPAKYRWSQVYGDMGVSPAELKPAPTVPLISHEQAVEHGMDFGKLIRVGDWYYYRPKEMTMRRPKKANQPKEIAYDTIGVRFLDGQNLAKVFTYRVPKKAKLHLGQEIIVPTDKSGNGNLTSSVAVVVEIHDKPQDNEGYSYKFVRGTIRPL